MSDARLHEVIADAFILAAALGTGCVLLRDEGQAGRASAHENGNLRARMDLLFVGLKAFCFAVAALIVGGTAASGGRCAGILIIDCLRGPGLGDKSEGEGEKHNAFKHAGLLVSSLSFFQLLT
ncbi:MAG: hypothetical protein ABI584_06030 [Acidobacteriota bacterium]